MNLHLADLTNRMSGYLARRTPPKGLGADDGLKAKQIGEYVSILRRFAPEGDPLTEWWRAFESALADVSETWAWPAPKDVVRAAKAAGSSSKPTGNGWAIDSVAINLARLNAGEPIGEDWLWGRGAIRLEAAGASRQVLRSARLRMADAMAAIYTPEAVRDRLRELKDRHEAARACKDDFERGHYSARIPDKRAFSKSELEALVE